MSTDRAPIQARGLTSFPSGDVDNAPTELARIVAASRDWLIDSEGAIVDQQNAPISICIEHVAHALEELEILIRLDGQYAGVAWTYLTAGLDDDVRQKIREAGHPLQHAT